MGTFIQQTNLDIRGDIAKDIEAKYPAEFSGSIMTIMQETGCSVKEAVAAARGGK